MSLSNHEFPNVFVSEALRFLEAAFPEFRIRHQEGEASIAGRILEQTNVT
ncbi:MAG: hypothetical protein ACI8T1_004849 [Verrucomicrobiales bacterium]|jgi:hypothetical protein